MQVNNEIQTDSNDSLIEEISKLREKYKSKWGQSVFSLPMPCVIINDISVQQLRDILLKIVDTGENISEGYIRYIVGRPLSINDLVLNSTVKISRSKRKR